LTETIAPSKPHKGLKWLLAATVFIGISLVALPYGIQYGIIKGLTEAGSKQVFIEDVDFNVFTGELSVKRLRAKTEQQPELTIKLVTIKLDWLPLFDKHIHISSLLLKDTSLIISQPDPATLIVGGINIPLETNAPDNSTNADETPSKWDVGLNELHLINNSFIYASPTFSETFTIDDFLIDHALSWEPDHVSHFAFKTLLNTHPISGEIDVSMFANEPLVEGSLNIEGLELNRYHHFVKEQLTELEGIASVDIQFSARFSEKGLDYKQTGILSIDKAKITTAALDSSIESLGWEGELHLQLVENSLDYQQTAALFINKINLKTPTLTNSLESVHWKGESHFQQNDDEQSFDLNGHLELSNFTSKNPKTKLTVASLQRLTLEDVALSKIEDIKISSLGINKLSIAKKKSNKPFIYSKNILVKGISIQNTKDISINKITVNGLNVQAAINKQDEIDALNQLIKSLETPKPEKAIKKAAKEKPGQLRIGSINISKGSTITLSKATEDGTLKRNIKINVAKLGELNTLKPKKMTSVKLNATIDKFSTLTADGRFAPFSKKANLDIQSSLKALEFHGFSPLARKQIGYDIQHGQLNADINVAIKENILDGLLKLDINGLKLKAADQDKASALSQQLPIPLDSALNLLRDSNDDIKLKLPVEGDIASPDFELSDVINTALINALQGGVKNLLKFALQPYGAIYMVAEGAIGAMNSIKLDAVVFNEGDGALSTDALTYLERIGELMKKSPNLRVRVCGIATRSDMLLEPDATNNSKDKPEKQPEPLSEAQQKSLLELAKTRSTAVKTLLISTYSIEASRLFGCAPAIDETTDTDKPAIPRVDVLI